MNLMKQHELKAAGNTTWTLYEVHSYFILTVLQFMCIGNEEEFET